VRRKRHRSVFLHGVGRLYIPGIGGFSRGGKDPLRPPSYGPGIKVHKICNKSGDPG